MGGPTKTPSFTDFGSFKSFSPKPFPTPVPKKSSPIAASGTDNVETLPLGTQSMEMLADDVGKQEDPGQPAESGERPYFAGNFCPSSRAPTRDFLREEVT